MNALWIIDLTESENAVKAFYDSYWKAFLENQKDPNYPKGKREPWFSISTPEDLDLTIDNNITAQDIGNKVYGVVRKADHLIDPINGMIKYDFADQNEFNRIIVILMGDTNSISTRRFFLPLSTSLKYDTQQPQHWNPTPNVYFYGMLYRREEVTNGTDLKAEEKSFLNQLHNMQNAWNSFDHVLFFEKPFSQRNEAINNMALASLHLSFEDSHNNPVLIDYSNRDFKPTFLNAGVSGIFFEREVQNDREAFLMGHTLLEPFVNSKEKEFFDKDSAKERAQNISTFKNNELDVTKLYRYLSVKMPSLDTSQFDIPMPIKPGSINVKEVWKLYFDSKDGYIANLKARLVNKVRLELDIYEHDYLEKMSENQLAWIKEQSAAVEDGIFGVFDDEQPDPHCSMYQAIEVAKQAEILASKKGVGEAKDISILGEDGLTVCPLPIPEQYEKAYETAKLGNTTVTEQKVLDELDKKLRRHPVFMLSMFSRALLLSIILGVFFIFSQPIVAAILFAIPIVAYFLVYRRYMNVLKSLQERYVGISLYKLNERLLLQYKKAIRKSQNDIKDYCEWNYKERLAMLRNNLGVFVPKEFHFEPFEDFQPLLTDNLRIKTKDDKVKKVGRDEGKVEETAAMTSGKFDNISLINIVPNFTVKAEALGLPQPKSIMDLTNADKMQLIRKLMKQTAFVPQQMEENLDPAKMILKTAGSAVLMLDVSGSMSGQPHEDLKEAVKTLKEKFSDKIRWVAFADRAVLDDTVNDDLDKAEVFCGGGTAYVPAFELLKKAHEEGEINLGKLIIISDGCPFDTEEAKRKILELGCVVDVIYIGGGNENYLRELAESTGGTLQQVQDVRNAQIETVVEEGIKTGFKLADEGNFPFSDLLRKSAIKPSMKALLFFAKKIMITSEVCMERMIADNGSDAGLNNWLTNHAKMCSMNLGALQQEINIHIKSSGIDQDSMCNKFHTAAPQFLYQHNAQYKLVVPIDDLGTEKANYPDSPDILVTQLHIQPLSGLQDLGWSYDAYNDMQIDNEKRFDQLFRSYFAQNYHFVNIYNQPIV
jgi:uncharacterized protein YegL